MPHKFGFSLLELCAIAAGCVIVLRPELFAKSRWLRYGGAVLLIGLGIVHFFGFSLLSVKFP